MSGIDWNKINELEKQIEKDQKGGGVKSNILKDWSIGEEGVKLRILPPTDNMDGIYFVRKVTMQFGDHYVLSKETFDEACVMQELLEDYKKSTDPDVKQLLNNWRKLKIRRSYLVNALVIGSDGNPESNVIFEIEAKRFGNLHYLMSQPEAIDRGGSDSIASREKGKNIIIRKTGKNEWKFSYAFADTDYSDAKYDDFYENKSDLWKFVKGGIRSDVHAISVVKNYFEGTPIIEDDGTEKAKYLDAVVDDAEPNDNDDTDKLLAQYENLDE